MANRWTETVYDEWWAEGIGAVLDVQGVLWYGYPVDGGERVGPFRSRLAAQRALEAATTRARGGDAALSVAVGSGS